MRRVEEASLVLMFIVGSVGVVLGIASLLVKLGVMTWR